MRECERAGLSGCTVRDRVCVCGGCEFFLERVPHVSSVQRAEDCGAGDQSPLRGARSCDRICGRVHAGLLHLVRRQVLGTIDLVHFQVFV